MISDPRTSPNHPVARILWAVLIAAVAFYLAAFKWMYNTPIWVLVAAAPLVPVLEDALKIVFGANPLRVEAPIAGATEVLGLFFPNYRLFVMLLGAALITAVWLLVFRTSLGAVVRAAAYDRHMSASLGVPVQRVYAATFAFGVALAGIAGVLLAPIYSVFPTMGRDFVLIAFSVVIIGGMGSIKGAVLAGLLLTQVQSISSLYISPVWSDPLLFGIMVLVLMWRPQGLFGKLGSA